MSDELTAKAQRLLNELGYDVGPVDGVMRKKPAMQCQRLCIADYDSAALTT